MGDKEQIALIASTASSQSIPAGYVQVVGGLVQISRLIFSSMSIHRRRRLCSPAGEGGHGLEHVLPRNWKAASRLRAVWVEQSRRRSWCPPGLRSGWEK